MTHVLYRVNFSNWICRLKIEWSEVYNVVRIADIDAVEHHLGTEGFAHPAQADLRLARAVYVINDERAEIKKTINQKFGSKIVEEKSYKEYKK